MFRGFRSFSTYRIKSIRVKIILAALILMISFGVHVLSAAAQNKEFVFRNRANVPLLLNSGLVEAEKAEIKVILWFEHKEIPQEIYTNGPTPNWAWTYKELQTDNEKVLVTLTGQDLVHKSEEQNLFTWYTTMVPKIEKAGGRIYLDERIPEVIDSSAYLSHINAIPAQWLLAGSMISTAAYQDAIETNVMAGQDRVNIQILCRGNCSEGQSVLAIPVLLNEF